MDMKDRVDKWLNEQLSKDTNGEMRLSFAPQSEDDKISPNEMLDLIQFYDANHHIDVEEYILQFISEKFEDYLNQAEFDMINGWITRAEAIEDPEFKAEVSNALNIWAEENDDVLERAGYQGIDIDVKDFIAPQQLNLLFATPSERNYEMELIPAMMYSLRGEAKIPSIADLEENSDNALSYLIHQQGYDWAEVYNICVRGMCEVDTEEVNGSWFTNSLATELNNTSGSTATLTALVQVDANSLIDLLEATRGIGDDKYVTFSKTTAFGLFDNIRGGGAYFEIELEKPAVLPVNMLKSIQVEHTTYGQQKGDHTVNSVYGFDDKIWERGTVTITKDAPELTKEDFAAARKALVNAERTKDEFER